MIQSTQSPSLFGYTLAGLCTTASSIPIVHPIYTLCTLILTEKNVRSVVMPQNRLAWRVLYRGIVANGTCDMSGQITAFFAYGYFNSQTKEYLGGLAAGAAASPVFNLLDRIMTIQQATGRSFKETVKIILRHEGSRGFLKGNGWTIAQETLYQSCFFTFSNQLAQKFSEKTQAHPTLSRAATYFSTGLVIGVMTTPTQYVRTLMHNQLGLSSWFKMCREIPRHERLSSLANLARFRIPLLSINMLVAGIAKDFFLQNLPSILYEKT